jgi:lipopolysaccharide export system permease protein
MMRILRRYYLGEFLKLFLILSLGLSSVFSLIDMVNKIDDFIPYKPSVWDLLRYAALLFPGYLLYLLPMAALMSGLFVVGQAGRKKETVAIKTAGGRLKALFMPFVFFGILLSIASFLIGEFLVPDLSKKANRLRDSITRKEQTTTFQAGAGWMRTRDFIIKTDLCIPDSGLIKGISILRIRDDMLIERIEAESAEWHPASGSGPQTKGAWFLSRVTFYDVGTGTVKKYTVYPTDIIDAPRSLGKGMQKPEEMTMRELFAYTKRLKEAGIKNIKLTVDIYARLSYPLINFIMLILGVSLAARGEQKSGLMIMAVGICVSVLYWFGYTASLSLGYTGILPPLLAAWLVPAVFGIGTMYLFQRIPE